MSQHVLACACTPRARGSVFHVRISNPWQVPRTSFGRVTSTLDSSDMVTGVVREQRGVGDRRSVQAGGKVASVGLAVVERPEGWRHKSGHAITFSSTQVHTFERRVQVTISVRAFVCSSCHGH